MKHQESVVGAVEACRRKRPRIAHNQCVLLYSIQYSGAEKDLRISHSGAVVVIVVVVCTKTREKGDGHEMA